ncbi:MAG: TetR/AcrR family transcriptional regulator [Hyphomicrobium aestuarii]|nr:TetR/AcrR family transcriptional regulator [Hyphomicrobium aestuarii]
MARPQSVQDQDVMERLSCVFRDVGYDGASLAILSEATGLKKASLYHRFPGGKQQMAEEVLAAALSWYHENVLEPLRGDGPPAERIACVARQLDSFYSSGRQACLLNMLASPRAETSPFSAAIKGAFEALIAAFTAVAHDAGHVPDLARSKAERTVMLLHGSLVMSRGLGSGEPFQAFLAGLAHDLIADTTAPTTSNKPKEHKQHD